MRKNQSTFEELEAQKQAIDKTRIALTSEAQEETEAIIKRVSSTLESLEFIDIPEMKLKIAHLPLWPTKSHIDGLLQLGKLRACNIFLNKEEWKNAKIDPGVPQVFGYTITNDAELSRVITDKEALDKARKEVEASGTFPTIYILNHEARLAHAAYLGGRLPVQKEQKSIWNKLPGANVLEKAISGSIPFSGRFCAINREFWYVGESAYLLSSSKYADGHENLNLYRDDIYGGAGEYISRSNDGLSSLVIFG